MTDPNSFKFLTTTSSKMNKAYFVKKAAIVNGEKNFKFNFDIDTKMDDLSLEESGEGLTKVPNLHGPSKIDLPSSDGIFKFNFAVDTDETV